LLADDPDKDIVPGITGVIPLRGGYSKNEAGRFATWFLLADDPDKDIVPGITGVIPLRGRLQQK
jgi:hypothetical protein